MLTLYISQCSKEHLLPFVKLFIEHEQGNLVCQAVTQDLNYLRIVQNNANIVSLKPFLVAAIPSLRKLMDAFIARDVSRGLADVQEFLKYVYTVSYHTFCRSCLCVITNIVENLQHWAIYATAGRGKTNWRVSSGYVWYSNLTANFKTCPVFLKIFCNFDFNSDFHSIIQSNNTFEKSRFLICSVCS